MGTRAIRKYPAMRYRITEMAKNTPSIQASHLAFTGMMKKSRNCRSGYRVAKAKNMDIFT